MKLLHILAILLMTLVTGCASTTRPGSTGITRPQLMLVPASTVERLALNDYASQQNKAKSVGRLIERGPEYERLRQIGDRLIAQTSVFRDDAKQWKWDLKLIDAPVLNASCAPGGKITFYTGIVRQLQLTDDEIAAVMGHEIAHAIREHGREKLSQAMGQEVVVTLAAALGNLPRGVAALGSQAATLAYTLPNSREKELEADKIGAELMARAGYNPAGALSVWHKMIAATQGKTAPPFLSTHPSHTARITELQALQQTLQPLYEAASKDAPVAGQLPASLPRPPVIMSALRTATPTTDDLVAAASAH